MKRDDTKTNETKPEAKATKIRVRTGLRAGHSIVSPRDPQSGLPTG